MNTATHQEVQALHPVAPAQPSQSMLLVPLSRLRFSKRKNVRKIVRKTAGQSIEALAASVERVGLLQNLTVIPAADGEHYEVVAGGRRLAALKLLAKKHRIPKDWNVPCLLVADASARTASLTENVQREAMHPADQFEAFAALVSEGRPIDRGTQGDPDCRSRVAAEAHSGLDPHPSNRGTPGVWRRKGAAAAPGCTRPRGALTARTA